MEDCYVVRMYHGFEITVWAQYFEDHGENLFLWSDTGSSVLIPVAAVAEVFVLEDKPVRRSVWDDDAGLSPEQVEPPVNSDRTGRFLFEDE